MASAATGQAQAAPKDPANLPLDPYVDPIPHNPGEPVPQPEPEAPEARFRQRSNLMVELSR